MFFTRLRRRLSSVRHDRKRNVRRRQERLQHEPLEERRLLALSDVVNLTGSTTLGWTADTSPAGFANNYGALYSTSVSGSSGSGVMASFVRISTNGNVVEGYNSSARSSNPTAPQFHEDSTLTFNHDLLLSDVPIVVGTGTNGLASGVTYREFMLDINQSGSSSKLSLDKLEIYLSAAGGITQYPFTDGTGPTATKVYDMDFDTAANSVVDNAVFLDNSLGSGSGSANMFLYLPSQLFVGGGSYVTLFSRFGDNIANSGGGEEWGVRDAAAVFDISGMKFNDLDADGVRDAGDPGLPGWTIYIDADNDGVLDGNEFSTVTAADGSYSFASLVSGTHVIREVQQPTWTQSAPASGFHSVTITNADVSGQDFGNYQLTGLSGVKFEDLDADGAAREAGEPGLPGWTIYVDYDNDNSLDAGEPFSVTAADGSYLITGVNPGTWRVKEMPQAGWINSFPALGYYEEVFNSGATITGNDFGNWQTASKSGVKFEDLDADGAAREAGEPGLPGWTIYIDYDNDNSLDAGEPFAVTVADGSYTITGINPGTWLVKEVAQVGWTNSFPALGYHEDTFTSGMNLTGNDFGNWKAASKSGVKFEDLDADGAAREAGEPGLPGWTIYIDYDNDNVRDAGEPFAVTAADGSYTITGINPGTWRAKEVAQAGWTNSFPALGYHEDTFTSGMTLTGNSFGNWRTASKSGVKFEDLDADGVAREPGEPGLPGWTIYIDYDNDNVRDAGEPFAVTAADGSYTITGINPGTWRVKEVAQAGWSNSFPALGYYQDTFTSGVTLTGNNFGNWRSASKSGVKFEDLDADGASREAGEPGLPGWTIYVDYDNDGVRDAGEPFAVTAADGSYTINGIKPGTWRVKEVMQAGWTNSFPALSYYQDTFSSGASLTGNNFGNWRSATKTGVKFEDLDADGAPREAGEPGLPGWTFYVDYDNDGVKDAGEPFAVSGANGSYTITGIKPGTWRVKEVAQAGWTNSFPALGYYQDTFTSGATLNGNNFGNWRTASKSGVKFEDLDADGAAREAGEPGLPGWTIYVDYDNDGVKDAGEPFAVTAADGSYTINGIKPGTWRVKEVMQAGWINSFPALSYYQDTFTSGARLTGNNFGNWRSANRPQLQLIVLGDDKGIVGQPYVQVIDSVTGQQVFKFLAYESNFVGGVRVATGDMNGDGLIDIITAPGKGRAPEVRVFLRNPQLAVSFTENVSFRTMAYAASFVGGVDIAVGDVVTANNTAGADGKLDIVTAPSSGVATINVFKNQFGMSDPILNTPVRSFAAFSPSFLGGAVVKVADMGTFLNGTTVNATALDGRSEIIVGNGPGMRSTVKVFDVSGTPAAVRTFLPFANSFLGGVSIDLGKVNANDAIPDLIVGAGYRGQSQVQVLDGRTTALLKSLTAYTGTSQDAPVRVAARDITGDGIVDLIFTAQGANGSTRQIKSFQPLTGNQVNALFETDPNFFGAYYLAMLQ